MAASEAFIAQGEGPSTAASPVAMASGPVAASPLWPQLIPVAQLLAIVLGVLGIIWHQQQTTDSLRSELTADINRVETTLTADINRVETTLTADVNRVETGLDQLRADLTAEINGVETGLRTELGGAIEELRAEVANNGQRLARIEGFLGTDIPDDPTQ